MSLLLKKLTKPHIWRRIGIERLAEPLHLNLSSAFVAAFGSFRAKVAFDLIVRQHLAFGLLRAADWAKALGIDKISALEFGVARGAGLLNMCDIAARVNKSTGVSFEITGFDTGLGMPPPAIFGTIRSSMVQATMRWKAPNPYGRAFPPMPPWC